MSLAHLRARLAFLAIVILLLATTVPAFADDTIDGGTLSATDNETPSNWFVELATPSTSEGGSAAAAAASKDAFRASANAKGVSYSERFAYGDLWNGLSIRTSAADAARLQGIAGVKNVWPVISLSLAEPVGGGEQIDLATAITMTNADYVQNTLGITGKNIKVAVMDTGIDYNNPDLGGCFGPSCRVFTGWDFVGDGYDAGGTGAALVPHPDPDPMDCNGHGTHVSGIVGAKAAGPNGVTGVAPDVRFGAYRVFGCAGSTDADIMLAAMERALADHMDVLNMSIGSAFQWPQYPTAVAADRLVTKHGMVVVASIGNSGPQVYSAGAPGVGENVIGVASFDNIRVTLNSFIVDGTSFGYTLAAAAPLAPLSGSLPMAKTGTPTTSNDGCAALPAGSMAGKAVLIRRGTCGFYVKAFNAQTAGAAAVVLYNNAAGFINPTVAPVPPTAPAITIPVVAITAADGATLNSKIAAGPTTLTWTPDTISTPSATGNQVSSFSSFGLAPDLSIKPDIGAPGGNIWSTLPLAQGGHGSLSGTSMSSPHVAGAVALLLEANPKKLQNDPGIVRTLLQNTASPRAFPGTTFTDTVSRQGAGMLDIRAAIEANAYATPGKIALGESQGAPSQTRTLTLTSKPGTGEALTYTFSHQAAIANTNNTYAPGFATNAATVTFSAPAVTIKNNKSASVDVTITAPTAPAGGLYSGYLVANGSDGSTLRVPYSGYIGDYQSIVVLTGTKVACRTTDGANFVTASGTTFTFANLSQTPFFCVHFNHQSRSVTFKARNTATNTTYTAQAFDYFGRNSTATGFFAFSWDGASGTGDARANLPNGTYALTLDVLKALGDPAVPSQTEHATLGTITLARP